MTEDEYDLLEWDLAHEGDTNEQGRDMREDYLYGECEGCGAEIWEDDDGVRTPSATRYPAGGDPSDGTILLCEDCILENE